MCASADQTLLFADLASFTALTEAHGDEPAADLQAEHVGAGRHWLPSPRTAARRTRTEPSPNGKTVNGPGSLGDRVLPRTVSRAEREVAAARTWLVEMLS